MDASGWLHCNATAIPLWGTPVVWCARESALDYRACEPLAFTPQVIGFQYEYTADINGRWDLVFKLEFGGTSF
jgi:hypothetical protein